MLHSPENAKDCICVTMQFYGFVPQHVLCLLIITFDLIGSSQLWVGETERFGPDQPGEEEVPGDLISVRRHLKGGRKEDRARQSAHARTSGSGYKVKQAAESPSCTPKAVWVWAWAACSGCPCPSRG